MKFKKIMFVGIVLLVIFAIGTVSASDVNETAIANEDTNQMELSTSNEITEDNLQTNEENNILTQTNNNESVGTSYKRIYPEIECPSLMIKGHDKYVTCKLPSDAKGALKILVDEIDMNVSIKNGKSKFSLKNIDLGEHYVKIIYSNDSIYDDYEKVFCLDVITEPVVNITFPDKFRLDTKSEVIITCSEELISYIDIEFSGDEHFELFKDGKVTVGVMPQKLGLNKFKYRLSDVTDKWTSIEANVFPKNPIITASDFKTYYGSKSKYRVLVKDNNYKKVVGGKVTFYLYKITRHNSKTKLYKSKTVKTDKNGYASVNFDVIPEDDDTFYKIKTKYGSTTVTKKYTLKSIVKINDVLKHRKNTVKVTVVSNKIVMGATLKKVDGKYLKGKKIKFTIYKQTIKSNKLKVYKSYTAKTNSRGVAKLTFKKAPVKFTYEYRYSPFLVKISYGKDSKYASFLLLSKSPFEYYFVKTY